MIPPQHSITPKPIITLDKNKKLESILDPELLALAREIQLVTSAVDIELDKFITVDEDLIELKNKVRKLAPANISVLIIGESGVGKELIARALHGNRPSDKFIGVNTAGIPDTLLESEFFGVRRGAYTGADRDRRGYLELAEGGTLFLDEIGDMPLLLQSKLLRIIQERRARRLGDEKEYIVNCRFIAATNKTFTELKSSGTHIRQDLLYRLAGIVLQISPLRERIEDAKEICKSHNIDINDLRFSSNMWHGNVRELLNKIEEHKLFYRDNNHKE